MMNILFAGYLQGLSLQLLRFGFASAVVAEVDVGFVSAPGLPAPICLV